MAAISLVETTTSRAAEKMAPPSGAGTKFYLCGFPILHSASPDFHNYIFDLLENGGRYMHHSTSKVTPKMLELFRSDDFGGSSVTMPIKVAIISHLDGVTPEGRMTGAVNTVVPVYNPTTQKRELVGTNTDFLGIRNALLRTLRLQHPSRTISVSDQYAPGAGSALVIGGGATTRSAVYALHTLGLSPIFLVNRFEDEVRAVRDSFPHLRSNLIHLDSVATAESYLAPPAPFSDGTQSSSSNSSTTSRNERVPGLLMIVGAIPALAPHTPAERLVYTIVASILTIPYSPPPPMPSATTAPGSGGLLPLPQTRLFLEMAYKPRLTPMLRIASALGWAPIDGIQAMIEQGLAQERMWKAGSASVEVGSDRNGLGAAIDDLAREMVENMSDVVVTEEEIDLALVEG